jgi:phage shock protein A
MIYRGYETRSQLTELKRHLATAVADEQRLYQRYFEADQEAGRWRRRAEFAVSRGEDGLARGALERANRHAANAEEHRRGYLEQKQYVESMKGRLRDLEIGVPPRRVVLLPPPSPLEAERSLRRLEQLEERAWEERARLAAWLELERDELAERIAALEREDQLERQLAELKRKLGRD